jgi:hypothetical protein
MNTVVQVPSFWVLAYLTGIVVGLHFMSRSYKYFNFIFTTMMFYLLGLTIGLRLYYGS